MAESPAQVKAQVGHGAMEPAFKRAHQRRMSTFIEHHDENVDKERYKRKIRIKSMKRPHLSKETLHQMYGTHRYKTAADSEKGSRKLYSTRKRHLGPITGFGDGNGSFWDRWLVKEPPPKSSFAKGDAYPLRGYKRLHPNRYQVYKEAQKDPNGQHTVHDFTELVGMFPDNPLSIKLKQKAELENAVRSRSLAKSGEANAHTSKSDTVGPLRQHIKSKATTPRPAPKIVRKALKTPAATDALLKFEKLVEKSTRALAGSCELVDPFWQPPPEEE